MYKRGYRRKRALSTKQILGILFGLVLFLGILAFSSQNIQLTREEVFLLIILGLLLLGGISLSIIYGVRYLRKKRFENITLLKVDTMSGIEFEDFVGYLFELQGYRIQKTAISGDLGVDLVALKDGAKTAIQVKRYKDRVGRSAISDAVAGMAHYNCQNSLVITNSYFTPLAIKLAYANRCKLIDRNELLKLIALLPKQNKQSQSDQ